MANPVNVFGALAKFFSPTIKAAKELLQEKGSYEQLKSTMLKNGAKADELEWSGADDFFKGKKVTKSEIIQYLTENDPRLEIKTRKVDSGLTGESPSYGVVDERNRAVAEAMEDTTMVNEEKLNILDNMKSNPDDLVPLESEVAFGSYGDTNSEILEQIKNSPGRVVYSGISDSPKYEFNSKTGSYIVATDPVTSKLSEQDEIIHQFMESEAELNRIEDRAEL